MESMICAAVSGVMTISVMADIVKNHPDEERHLAEGHAGAAHAE